MNKPDFKEWKNSIAGYFDLSTDLLPQEEAENVIREGVSFRLATFQMTYFFGALFLFFINSVFIALATTVGVKLMKYHVKDFSNPLRAKRVRNLIYTIAILTMLPAAYLTWRVFQQSAFNTNCQRFIEQQFNFDGMQVLHSSAIMKGNEKTLTVSLIGKVLPQDSLVLALTDKLPDYNLG